MRSLKIILFFLLFPLALMSQSKADSLIGLIAKDKSDTNKVNHLNALAIESWGNLDTAIICSSKALETAKAIGWQKGVGRSLYLLGVFHFDKGEFAEALELNSQAALLWGELENQSEGQEKALYKLYRTKSIGEIGNAYYGQSNYPKALEYQLIALKLNEEMNREEGIAATSGNIGNIYVDQKQFDKALQYYNKSLAVGRKLNKLYDVSVDLRNIAILYNKMDKPGQSLAYSLAALEASNKIGNDIESANNMCSAGSALLEIGDSAIAKGAKFAELRSLYTEAMDYFNRSVKLQEAQGNIFGVAMNYSNIAAIHTLGKNYREAESYLLKALAIDSSLGSMFQIQQMHYNLSDLYFRMGDYKRSLEHYRSFSAAKDSLFSEEKDKDIARHELNFEFQKREAELKAEQDKKAVLAEAEKKRQNVIMALISIVALAIALIAVIVFRALRTTRKQKLIIEEQKEMVEAKQKAVTESIQYAKRIQQSLLPTDKYIERSLKRLKK